MDNTPFNAPAVEEGNATAFATSDPEGHQQAQTDAAADAAAAEVVAPVETIVDIQVHLIGNRLGVKAAAPAGGLWDETNPAHVLTWYIKSNAAELVNQAISAWRAERERIAAFLAAGGAVEELKAEIAGGAANDSEGGTPA